MDAIWHDMMVSGIPLAEKVIRTVAVYGFLIAGLRLFGKRELGQLNPLDFIVLLLLSNTVQIVINDVLVRYSYRYPKLRRLIEGRAEVLIKDGHVIAAALGHNLITREELQTAARKQGIEHFSDVSRARLEVSGAVSAIMPASSPFSSPEPSWPSDALRKKSPSAAAPTSASARPWQGWKPRSPCSSSSSVFQSLS